MQQLGLSSRRPPKEESRLRAFLWPDIHTVPGINSIVDTGKIAAFAVGGLTCLLVLLKSAPVASLIDGVLFIAIGFGIARKSCVCAILGFFLYLAGQILAYWTGRGGWNVGRCGGCGRYQYERGRDAEHGGNGHAHTDHLGLPKHRHTVI